MHSPPTLTVISLGAGVQSSAMALMASQGAFDRTPLRHLPRHPLGAVRRPASPR